MNIFSLVNSKTIGNYLKKINYEFDSLEVAWLIYACRELSFEEKKMKWDELIRTMPDCEVPKRNNCVGWKSLHMFLTQYITIIDRELTQFYEEDTRDTYVYMYSYLYVDDDGWYEEYETIYPSLNKCLDAYKSDVEHLGETHSTDKTGVIKYRIKRQSLIDCNDVFEIEFFADGELCDVIINTKRTEKDSEIINESFEGLWFDFPTPFQKGDVVWVPTNEKHIRWNCDGGFVLLGLSTWNPTEFIKESGDNSDMNGYGYFVNQDGTVYREVMQNYMDLEYYSGQYKLNEKILPALSKFIKGEIGVDFLLCVYRKVLLDVASDDIMLKSWFSEEILQEIGIK